MTAMEKKQLVVSAPGKILVAGGYLVLESPNVGLVFGVDKRFYCQSTFYEMNGESNEDDNQDNHEIHVTVKSLQFEQTWNYTFDRLTKTFYDDNDRNDDNNPSSSTAKRNVLIERTLCVALLYVTHAHVDAMRPVRSIHMEIRADNDFYSLWPHLQARNLMENGVVSLESIQQLPPCLPVVHKTNDTANDSNSHAPPVLKTGLGSSACLVTSIVGALLFYVQDDLQVIHNLSQLCHCHAQGKIGSGFDVSAACYGSQVYIRFFHEKLSELLKQLEQQEQHAKNCSAAAAASSTSIQDVQSLLVKTVRAQWDGGVQGPVTAVSLPPTTAKSTTIISNEHGGVGEGEAHKSLLQVSLADVSGGSESPSMARAVLQWKKNSQDISHWNNLTHNNKRIVELLQLIASKRSSVTQQERSFLATTLATTWMDRNFNSSGEDSAETTKTKSMSTLLFELRQAFVEARCQLKRMGVAANVPIEPEEQSRLADATMDTIPGVVAAFVPGAGGYDALACIHIQDDNVRRNLCNFWGNWSSSSSSNDAISRVCPLTVQGVSFGDGVRLEEPLKIVEENS